MSPMRQGLLVLLLLVVAGGGWWLWTAANAPDSPANGAVAGGPPGAGPGAGTPRAVPVVTVTVRADSIAETIEAVGTTRARQAVDVVSTVSGRVAEIAFEAGQKVRRGDPLVRLDAALEEAALAEARALMADSRAQLERARQLVASRTVAQARVEELQASFAAAQARVTAAERRVADRVVAAPFDGVVGLREVDVGTRVSENTVLTRLEDLGALQLEFQIPEVFFGRVTTGQPIEATSAAMPGQIFTGTITARDVRIDPVSRAFRVRAELPNPDGVLPPGLFMAARLSLATREDALIIPEQAVLSEGRNTYVYRIVDGRAERTEVRLGLRRIGEVEVISGLEAGDQVVTEGLQRLRPGLPVRVLGGGPPVSGDGPLASGSPA